MRTTGSSDKTALVLQHQPRIHLGNLAPVLDEHGYDVQIVAAMSDDLTGADPVAADVVIVLGETMGAYQGDEYPFIADELALIRARLDAERAIFGVCLGAQLMAGALGARVYAGE